MSEEIDRRSLRTLGWDPDLLTRHNREMGFYGVSDALYGAATDREALCVVVGMLGADAEGDKVMAYIKAYLEGKR